jgi:hypothetical protein
VRLGAKLDGFEKKKFSFARQESNSKSAVHSLVTVMAVTCVQYSSE